jgi:N-ethylmaleimide reductase
MPISLRLMRELQLHDLTLPNRIVMAPMVRCRADPETGLPGALLEDYYRQRADAGLLISEALPISAKGVNYYRASGLYTGEQSAGWQRVCDAVHEAGGRIFAQLVHAGRASHVLNQREGAAPVAPSAIPATTKVMTQDGFKSASPPRALELREIPGIVTEFADAARNAVKAGFDGVELHAANGYLLDQFLKSSSNQRTDSYGGSIANRMRLLLEVVDTVLQIHPRVGVRFAPGPAQDAWDEDPATLFPEMVRELAKRPLVYVHAVEGTASGSRGSAEVDYTALRKLFPGPWMTNNGYTRDAAEAALKEGSADMIAFGRLYIANPDLVRRLALGAELNVPDKTTFFEGDAVGLNDYPKLSL